MHFSTSVGNAILLGVCITSVQGFPYVHRNSHGHDSLLVRSPASSVTTFENHHVPEVKSLVVRAGSSGGSSSGGRQRTGGSRSGSHHGSAENSREPSPHSMVSSSSPGSDVSMHMDTPTMKIISMDQVKVAAKSTVEGGRNQWVQSISGGIRGCTGVMVVGDRSHDLVAHISPEDQPPPGFPKVIPRIQQAVSHESFGPESRTIVLSPLTAAYKFERPEELIAIAGALSRGGITREPTFIGYQFNREEHEIKIFANTAYVDNAPVKRK